MMIFAPSVRKETPLQTGLQYILSGIIPNPSLQFSYKLNNTEFTI